MIYLSARPRNNASGWRQISGVAEGDPSHRLETMMTEWVVACAKDDVDEEDVIRFDHGGRTFAIYRSPENEYFATDGLCTHEKVHLADGLVMDDVIECPKHNGQFNYRTGAALRAPVCVDLATYPVKVEGGQVYIGLD